MEIVACMYITSDSFCASVNGRAISAVSETVNLAVALNFLVPAAGRAYPSEHAVSRHCGMPCHFFSRNCPNRLLLFCRPSWCQSRLVLDGVRQHMRPLFLGEGILSIHSVVPEVSLQSGYLERSLHRHARTLTVLQR